MENFETYRLEQTGQQTQAILDQVSTNTADIAQLRALYEALTQSEPVIIQPSDTWPVADPQENVIYRVIDRVNTPPQSYSDYMWNGTAMVLMATYNNSIDNVPTPGSNSLVKSGGVAASIVFDISAYHATGSTLATYANLAAALGTDGANVPASVRKGGMSVKFVKSSDNKYVQARCMAQNFTTDVTQWQGVDDEPTAGSDNLVKSGGVAEVFGSPMSTVLDFTSGSAIRIIPYKVAAGWGLIGIVKNVGSTTSNLNIDLLDEYNVIKDTVSLQAISPNQTKEFEIVPVDYSVENLQCSISARTIFDMNISADKFKYLKNEIEQQKDISNNIIDEFGIRRGVIQSVQTASGDAYVLFSDKLNIKSGDDFELRFKADSDFSRIIVSTDSSGTNRLYDKFVTDTETNIKLKASSMIDTIYIQIVAGVVEDVEVVFVSKASLTIDDNRNEISVLGEEMNPVLYNYIFDYTTGDVYLNINVKNKKDEIVRFILSNGDAGMPTTVNIYAVNFVGTRIADVVYRKQINFGEELSVSFNPPQNVDHYVFYMTEGRTVLGIRIIKPRVDNLDNAAFPEDYTDGYLMDRFGTLHVNAGGKISPFMRWDGTNIVIKSAIYSNAGDYSAPCVFFDRNKKRLSSSFKYWFKPENEGTQDINIHPNDIPVDMAYFRCSVSASDGRVLSGYMNNVQDLQTSVEEGFSLGNCREYITKNLAYKPLGQLSKAYICFTDDDGTEPAITYTLPMVLQKDIPFTFLLMKESEIMENLTYREQFVNAVLADNSKIFISQHGGFNWTVLSEPELFNFFATQKAFWDSLGVEVKGAGCPTVYTSYLIEAMAGGIFDVHRAAWTTYDGQGVPNHHALYETYRPVSPARGNLYCLTSANIRDYSLAEWKEIIDYAIINKRLINIYMHDFDFVERWPSDTSKPAIHTATPEEVAERKALLEGVIDYAKSVDIEFISLGQTARII